MDTLLKLREQYGSVYIATLPDGRRIPFRLLNIGEFLEYDRLLLMGVYPRAYLEDEIFKKCVLDIVRLEYFNLLKAGDVTTVVNNILSLSGPQTTDQLVQDLSIQRQKASSGVHEMVGLICQAFPAYKPEEVYSLDYETFIFRLAQAEKKLLTTGILTEAISILKPGNQPIQRNRKEKLKSRLAGMKKEFDNQAPQVTRIMPQQESKAPLVPYPPLPPPQSKQVIITTQEMSEGNTVLGPDYDKIQMAKETQVMYPEYLKQVKDGQKVKILTSEERLANAKARVTQREKKSQEYLAKQKELVPLRQQAAKEDMERALEVKRKAEAKRRRKPR